MHALDRWWGPVAGRLRGWVHEADRRSPDVVSNLVRRLVDREILRNASSLAFYGLVSALPLLFVTFALVGAVAGQEVLRSFGDRISQSGPGGVDRLVEQLVSNADTVAWLTLLAAVWPASAYGGGLRRALGHASEEDTRLPGVRGRLMAVGLILALPFLVLAGMPLMFLVTNLSGDGGLATVVGWVTALLAGALVGTAVTTVLYQFFTGQELGWWHAARGAAATSVVTALFSLGFVIYLNVGDIEQRFGGGTIAVVVLLGVWLFVANVLLLVGYHLVLELGGSEPDAPTGQR